MPGTTAPKVAAYESCVSCYRGDTVTAIAIEGEAEFVIAAIHKLAGLSIDEATATFDIFARQAFGVDPGKVPTGRIPVTIRLCERCAAKTGAAIANVADIEAGDAVPGYRQET